MVAGYTQKDISIKRKLLEKELEKHHFCAKLPRINFLCQKIPKKFILFVKRYLLTEPLGFPLAFQILTKINK